MGERAMGERTIGERAMAERAMAERVSALSRGHAAVAVARDSDNSRHNGDNGEQSDDDEHGDHDGVLLDFLNTLIPPLFTI